MKESGQNNIAKEEKSGADFPNPFDVDELGHTLDDPEPGREARRSLEDFTNDFESKDNKNS